MYFLKRISSIKNPFNEIDPFTFSFSKFILFDELIASSLDIFRTLSFSMFTLGTSELYYAWSDMSPQNCARIEQSCAWAGNLEFNANVMSGPAVSGKNISLNDLNYWNVELQEAYFSPKEAEQRYEELKKK